MILLCGEVGHSLGLVQPLLELDTEEQICHPLFQGAVSDRSRAKHSPWSSEVLFWCADPCETGLCDFCIQTAYQSYKFSPTEACSSLTRALSWGLFSSVRGHWALLEMFLVLMTLRKGSYHWRLVGGNQGCCKSPVLHRAAPRAKNRPAPTASGAEAEKPLSG